MLITGKRCLCLSDKYSHSIQRIASIRGVGYFSASNYTSLISLRESRFIPRYILITPTGGARSDVYSKFLRRPPPPPTRRDNEVLYLVAPFTVNYISVYRHETSAHSASFHARQFATGCTGHVTHGRVSERASARYAT